MRTFILTKAYKLQLSNSRSNDEKASYLLSLVREYDKQKEKENEKD